MITRGIRSAARRWDRYWYRQVPPHAIAIFRIALGAFLFVYWLTFLPKVAMLFSDAGLSFPLIHRGAPDVLLLLLQPPSPFVAHVLHASLLLCLAGMTIGLSVRVCAGVGFILNAYFWVLSLHMFGGSFDMIFLFLMLVMACSHADATYSLRMRLRHGSWTAWEPVSILPQRIITAQMTATYFGVGWQKLWLPAWADGKILWHSMIGMWATPPAFVFARLVPWPGVYDVLVYIVKMFETFLPFGLWYRPAQKWFFLGGLIFHVSITLFLGMWWFMACPATYHLFLKPEELHAWLLTHIPVLGGKRI